MTKTKPDTTIEKTTEETSQKTTRALLMLARMKFLNSEISKSGKNSQLTYKYYELDDIVPVALPIFQELGLFYQVSFTNADLYEMNGSKLSNPVAEMKICKVDNPKDAVYIVIPYTRPQAIIGSSSGKAVVNDVQLVGMSVTYYRRYLWMLALDIVESDGIDGDKPAVETEQLKKSKKPASPEERKGMAKDMTSGGMTALQKKSILKGLKKLLDIKPDDKEVKTYISKINKKVKEMSYTKEEAENVLIEIGDKTEGESNE